MAEKPLAVAMHIARVLHPLLSRFHDNLRRVNNLVALYRDTYGLGSGRRPVQHADVLRAAVVFLHASFEEFLRSFAKVYLPKSDSTMLDRVPLYAECGQRRSEKFYLGSLQQFRGQFVDEVIEKSIEQYLDRISFNNIADLVQHLEAMSVPIYGDLKILFPALSELMARRHLIVHQADRTEAVGPGQQRARSLSVQQVDVWVAAVRQAVTILSAYVIEREFEDVVGHTMAEFEEMVNELKAEVDRVSAERTSSEIESDSISKSD